VEHIIINCKIDIKYTSITSNLNTDEYKSVIKRANLRVKQDTYNIVTYYIGYLLVTDTEFNRLKATNGIIPLQITFHFISAEKKIRKGEEIN